MTDAQSAGDRILLVDDEPAIRDSLGGYLHRGGYQVALAENGQQAWEVLASSSVDVLITDVMMPVLDGRSLVRRLREAGNWVPIILLTQVGESYERSAALDEGADDYLNKPFDPQELTSRIRAVLRRARAPRADTGFDLQRADVWAAAELRFDRRTRGWFLAGDEIALTPKASALLEFLMREEGALVSRERLLADLWGFDFPVSTRAVDHRVAEIRRVIGEDAANPRYLETVSGVGYRFLAQVRADDSPMSRRRGR